jgi:molybdopterin molybdotransferase
VLTSAVWADGLVEIPVDTRLKAGEKVRFIPFSELIY